MNRRVLTDDMAEDVVLARLGRDANLVFDRLLTITDDAGLCPGEPSLVKGRCFPLMDDLPTIAVGEAIEALVGSEMLLRRKYRDRVVLAFKPGSFREHQRLRTDYKRKFHYGKLSQAVWRRGLKGFSTVFPTDTEHDPNDSRTDAERGSPDSVATSSVSVSVSDTVTDTHIHRDREAIQGCVSEVFSHYAKKTGVYSGDPTTPQANIILDRLSEGFTVEQLKLAIDNICADPWPKRVNFRSIEGHLFGTRANLEKWLRFDPTVADGKRDYVAEELERLRKEEAMQG